MKTIVHALLFFVLLSFETKAQCSFEEPVIKPGKIILCPESSDTLYTEKVYDTYQWIKNGKPIPGATQRYLVINYFDDTPSFFKVAVSKNGCKDTSKRKLADGYAFAGPITISEGELGVYDPQRDATIQCPGDTVKLTFGEPYTENIQWYNQGVAIPGANQQSYIVTQSGSFTQCGAPAVCPNYLVCQNLPVNYYYQKPTATITKKADTLFASKAAQYQWFYFNKRIKGATKNYIVPDRNGAYSVQVIDKYTCPDLSNPFVYTTAFNAENLAVISPNPATSVLHVKLKMQVSQLVITDMFGVKRLIVSSPQTDSDIAIQSLQQGNYFLQVIGNNKELLKTLQFSKQ